MVVLAVFLTKPFGWYELLACLDDLLLPNDPVEIPMLNLLGVSLLYDNADRC